MRNRASGKQSFKAKTKLRCWRNNLEDLSCHFKDIYLDELQCLKKVLNINFKLDKELLELSCNRNIISLVMSNSGLTAEAAK
ncbi:hypothetical protein M5689_000175 [Euphorbia peplus]|nr:hypothetical protein M5689_000175 [Euphorbia peplus]